MKINRLAIISRHGIDIFFQYTRSIDIDRYPHIDIVKWAFSFVLACTQY